MHRLLILLIAIASLCLANRDNYVHLPPHGHYRYSHVKKTWDAAQAECEGEGANLAVINSPAEATALKTFFNQQRQSGEHWSTLIGFQDKEVEGRYETVRGGTLDTVGYNVWKYPPTGSSNNQIQDCGGFLSCGRLMEMTCSESSTFICELVPEPEIPDYEVGEVNPE